MLNSPNFKSTIKWEVYIISSRDFPIGWFSQFCCPTFQMVILKGLLVYLYWRESISIVINNKYRTLAGWQGCCSTHILTTNYLPHSLHKYIFIYFGYWLYLFNIMVASPTGMSIKLIVTLRKSNPTTSRFLSVFVISINILTVRKSFLRKQCNVHIPMQWQGIELMLKVKYLPTQINWMVLPLHWLIYLRIKC